MDTLQFTVDINAPADRVWSTMLDQETYREWTGAFHEGSRYTGGWNLGDEIRFVGAEDEGPESGMLGKIVANRPNEFVSIEYTGQIEDGVDDTTSEFAEKLIGCHENYSFREHDGITTVTVEVDSIDEFTEMFQEMWPPALAALKAIAER
ncbi:SRPBCC family protein [Plantibacter sp. YIM 135249]|uniref:SRPBCC family protein n=1 Tax=Plantibacter sp. YIM 135249 TaxID=3423918 RepID=UPI003D342BEF